MCIEYFYNEAGAKKFVDFLRKQNHEGIELKKGIDEECNMPCWEVSYLPKPIE